MTIGTASARHAYENRRGKRAGHNWPMTGLPAIPQQTGPNSRRFGRINRVHMGARTFDKQFTAQPYGWKVYFFTDESKWARFTSRASGALLDKQEETAAEADGLTMLGVDAQHIYLAVFNGEPGTLAHEAVHAANYMLDRAGVKMSYENDEAQAYLVGYIVDQCMPALVATWKNKR